MTVFSFAGAGWVSAVHGLALGTIAGTTIDTVASRTRERARERAAELGAVYAGYDALPGGADVVIVATNPGTHADHALRAAAGRAAAIIEKPLAASLDDADRIVDAASTGARFCYAENLLFAPVVGAALTEVAGLGPLTNLTVRALQARPTWGEYLRRSWGGGALFDLGPHPLALALRAARERVVAVSATVDGAADIEVDDHATVRLRFASGATATVEISWRATTPVWDLQAASANGVVRLDLLPDHSLERNGEPLPVPPLEATTYPPQLDLFGYRDQLVEAIAAFRAGESTTTSTVAFGRDVLEVICAGYASARDDGQWVDLPFTGDRSIAAVEHWLG